MGGGLVTLLDNLSQHRFFFSFALCHKKLHIFTCVRDNTKSKEKQEIMSSGNEIIHFLIHSFFN